MDKIKKITERQTNPPPHRVISVLVKIAYKVSPSTRAKVIPAHNRTLKGS